MKFKKVAALVLAGVMVFSLSACGGGGGGSEEGGSSGGDASLSVMIWDTYALCLMCSGCIPMKQKDICPMKCCWI